MAKTVLDASALLAFINNEPGADAVAERLGEAIVLAVNFSEVIAKLVSRGASPERAVDVAGRAQIAVVAFDRSLAELAGALVAETKSHGLSFADRACLALAVRENVAALTADRRWTGLPLGIKIILIR